MLRMAILGTILTAAFTLTAQAAAIWDGSVTITNVPPVACGIKKGQSFPTVALPKIAGQNPQNSQINIYLYRNTVHMMATNSSQFGGSGNWSGIVISENGTATTPSSTYSGVVLSPATIIASTTNFDITAGSFSIPGCGTIAVRGGFTKRP